MINDYPTKFLKNNSTVNTYMYRILPMALQHEYDIFHQVHLNKQQNDQKEFFGF